MTLLWLFKITVWLLKKWPFTWRWPSHGRVRYCMSPAIRPPSAYSTMMCLQQSDHLCIPSRGTSKISGLRFFCGTLIVVICTSHEAGKQLTSNWNGSLSLNMILQRSARNLLCVQISLQILAASQQRHLFIWIKYWCFWFLCLLYGFTQWKKEHYYPVPWYSRISRVNGPGSHFIEPYPVRYELSTRTMP
jgi:hypothetical protein